MKEFKTIKQKEVTAEVVEKKSKFIANIFYVESIEEAEEIIKKTKKKYFDARHNCVAYRIMEDDKINEKASDDGEPGGTAGGPMLNILKKNELINVLIIVTRYFGGILLGTGGLVRAYSESLQKAIENSTIVIKTFGEEYEVSLDYNDFDKFKYYCKNNDINIIKVEYLDRIICRIEVLDDKKEEFNMDIETKKINLINSQRLNKKLIDKNE